MTISVTDTALDMEKEAIERCARRSPCRSWLIWSYVSALLLSLSIFYVFWCTDSLRNYVQSQMVLRNGTRTFAWWQRPPFDITVKLYIFNYTNVDDFEAMRTDKLRVEELGPYIYKQTMSRVNTELHENGTVTYQEKKVHKWIGGRNENDTIVVPNVPLMSSTAYVRDLSFAAQLGLTAVLSTFQERSFIRQSAGGFLWGYDNRFFRMATTFVAGKGISMEKFGMMASTQGVNKDRITISTGTRGIRTLGMIERVNGMDRRNVWDDERCDRIEGTDGSMFPPHMLENANEPLYVYIKDMCRKIALRFSEHTTAYGIPVWRYKLSTDMSDFSRGENQCFCSKEDDSKVCPPTGIFNMSKCAYNVPMLSSFPHFYLADKSMREQIEGLNPRQEDHESYFDIHPTLGIPVAGFSKMQLNLEVRKAVGVPFLGRLRDGMILPLLWVDVGTNELPERVLDVLYMEHFTMGAVEATVQWCSLISIVIFLGALVAHFRKQHKEQQTDLQENSLGPNRLFELS